MSDYRRLTERSGKCIGIKETSTNDNRSIWNAIERLAELEDKIENGTLIELPCKVGDKLYMPWEYDGISDVATLTVKRIFVDDKCITTDLISDNSDFYKKYGFGVFMFDEMGTKVFLTEAEAEAKLRELNGE